MALAPIYLEPQPTTPQRTASSSGRGMMRALWNTTRRTLGSYQSWVGLGRGQDAEDDDTIGKASFKAFVTYVSLPCDDVMGKLTHGPPVRPRLLRLQERAAEKVRTAPVLSSGRSAVPQGNSHLASHVTTDEKREEAA